MKFRPLHDRVVVRRIEGEEKTKGGIIIPDTAKEKPQEGEIVAVGPSIRTAINGHPCAVLDDPSGARRGIVAFQLHSGGPTEVRFKDIVLELDPPVPARTLNP